MSDHLKIPLAVLAAALSLAVAANAHAGAFLYVEGADQGPIPGDALEQHHVDWIAFEDFSFSVSVPVGHDGLPAGPPEPSPVVVTKEFDRATIPLFEALLQVEQLPIVRIELTTIDPHGGDLVPYYRIDLEGGYLAKITQGGDGTGPTVEVLTFQYARITLEDLFNNAVTSYDWGGHQATTPDGSGTAILLPPTPNPTQGSAAFRFALPTASEAELTVYDLRGRKVRTVYEGWTPSNGAIATWDGRDGAGRRVAQGLYLARLTYPGRMVTQRVMVLR